LEIIDDKSSIEGDDTYFPTVEELVSFKKDGRSEQGLSGYLASQTVDRPAMEKRGHFGNPDKSILGRNIEGSQGGRTQSSHLR
jgi:hypothetical protein